MSATVPYNTKHFVRQTAVRNESLQAFLAELKIAMQRSADHRAQHYAKRRATQKQRP